MGVGVEEIVEEDGYTIPDPEIDTAYTEVHEIVRLIDYDGVSRQENGVEVPVWVSATEFKRR